MTQKNKKRTRIVTDFLPPIDAFEMNGHQIISSNKHPAMLSEEDLLKEVVLNFGRTGGAGRATPKSQSDCLHSNAYAK